MGIPARPLFNSYYNLYSISDGALRHDLIDNKNQKYSRRNTPYNLLFLTPNS